MGGEREKIKTIGSTTDYFINVLNSEVDIGRRRKDGEINRYCFCVCVENDEIKL